MTLFLPQEITKSISGTVNFLKNKFETGVIFGEEVLLTSLFQLFGECNQCLML